jgi:LAO/AO transport system kinase
MVDAFLMLQMPSTGDDLQSIKKGIIEMADVIAINKADGILAIKAEHAVNTHKQALQLVKTHAHWTPPVIACSATENIGIEDIWSGVESFIAHMKKEKLFSKRRARQSLEWFDSEVSQLILDHVQKDQNKNSSLQKLRKQVSDGKSPATTAARIFLKEIFSV